MEISVYINQKEIQYDIFKNYLLNLFERIFTWKNILIVTGLNILSAILYIGVWSAENMTWWVFFVSLCYILSAFGFYFLYLIAMRFIFPFQTFKKEIMNKGKEIEYKIVCNENNLTIYSAEKEKVLVWLDIIEIINIGKYLLINTYRGNIYVIPIRNFKNEEEIANFINKIQTGIFNVRGTIRVDIFTRTPYLIGILCFVPVLGVFFGIGYVIAGLFRYKNKIMVLIGVLGIMFTFLFAKLIVKNEDFNPAMEKISQDKLNSLIPQIEFYKLQKGYYPEKLEQLNDINIQSFNDPLQWDNKQNYNYELVGEKYKLFSSGLDKIPNTKDDLFPNEMDYSNTGLHLDYYNKNAR